MKSCGSLKDFCMQCQKCCRWEGTVHVSRSRLKDIADYLEISLEKAIDDYCDLSRQKRLILKSRKNHDCIFLTKSGCEIYPVRPLQCENFPHQWTMEDGAEDCPLVKQGIWSAKKAG